MKKFLIVFVGALALASAAQSATVKSITATTVGTAFSSLTGILTMNGITGIDVQDMADIVTTTSGGSFSLATTLAADLSSGGIAKAAFTGGNFSFNDAAAVVMLSGTISSFQLIELYNGSGIFAGDGTFTVTGGTLASGFGTPTGTLVDISFSVAPKTISNFSTGFTASSTMTVLPVPEPATMALLIPAVLAFRKRHSK